MHVSQLRTTKRLGLTRASISNHERLNCELGLSTNPAKISENLELKEKPSKRWNLGSPRTMASNCQRDPKSGSRSESRTQLPTVRISQG